MWQGVSREVAGMVRRTVLQSLKRLGARVPLSQQALLVRRLFPRRLWFRVAVAIAAAQGRLVGRMGGNGPFTAALMLTYWLRELSFGGQFPIPYRVVGAEVCRSPGPKLFTWTHLPLTEVPMHVYLDVGGEPPAVVADPGNIVDDREVLVVGWHKRMQAIPTDEQLLLRVRSKLMAGTPVVFLADQFLGGPLSDVPLRLAARLKVPLVFQWAELGADGVVEVEFRYAPFPLSEDEAAIRANLDFLQRKNREALAKLGWDRV